MPEKLPYEKFLESFRLAPRLAVELLIENDTKDILFLQREKEPFLHSWHLPGGFLLKDELLQECIDRLFHEELSDTKAPHRGTFVGLFENRNGDPRGHILHYVVKFHLSTISQGTYFSMLPNSFIPYQKTFLHALGYH